MEMFIYVEADVLLEELENELVRYTSSSDLRLHMLGFSGHRRFVKLLLSEVLNVSVSQLICYNHIALPADLYGRLCGMIKIICSGVSLAHCIKRKQFLNDCFYINTDVLEPRDDTASWVAACIDDLRSKKLSNIVLWDIGCGSGCIGISIAKALGSNVDILIMSDISDKASLCAKYNAQMLLPHNTKYKIIIGSFLNNIDISFFPTLIVANMPYVGLYDALWGAIYKEPEVALFSDDHGLMHNKTLLLEIFNLFASVGKVCDVWLEAASWQLNSLIDYARHLACSYGIEQTYTIVKDLHNTNRAVVLRSAQIKSVS